MDTLQRWMKNDDRSSTPKHIHVVTKKPKKLKTKRHKKENRAEFEPESFSSKECCYNKKIIVQESNKGPSVPSAAAAKKEVYSMSQARDPQL